MDFISVDNLAQKMQIFLKRYEDLRNENAQLKRAHAALLAEKEQIIHKQKNAISQIENMVTRLKSLEKLYDE